jgi:hypothetical protein
MNPDPVFQVNPDSNTDPDTGWGFEMQRNFFYIFLIKNCSLLMSKQQTAQEKPSALKREHPAIQK